MDPMQQQMLLQALQGGDAGQQMAPQVQNKAVGALMQPTPQQMQMQGLGQMRIAELNRMQQPTPQQMQMMMQQYMGQFPTSNIPGVPASR